MSRPSKFAHWIAAQSWREPLAIVEKYRQEMTFAANACGAIPPLAVEFDGTRKYLLSSEGKDDRKQYYVASLERHSDGTLWPEITFGSFKASVENQYWSPRNSAWQEFEVAKRGGDLTEDTENLKKYRLAIAEQMKIADELKKQREQLRVDANEAARIASLSAITEATRQFNAGENHPYLVSKGLVPDPTTRYALTDYYGRLYSYYKAEWQENALIIKAGDLVIPMREAVPSGKAWAIQRINKDGEKRFLSGSRKKGLCTKIAGKDDIFIVTEGWATAKTINDLTGATVFVAFDCGNLDAIVNFVRGLANGKPVILAADNDLATFYKRGKNPGIDAARVILEAQQVPFMSPKITPAQAESISDWDDFRMVMGAGHAKEVITKDLSSALRLWSGCPVNNPELVPVDRLVDNTTSTNQRMPSSNASGSSSNGGAGDCLEDEDGDVAVMQEQGQAIVDEKPRKPTHWGALGLDSEHLVPFNNFKHYNDKNTTLLDTRENLQALLETYGIECRYNKVSKDNEVIIPNRKFSRDNKSNGAMAEVKSLASRNRLPTGSIGNYMISIADKNAYNPVSDWIKSRKWDGVNRIQAVLDTLVTPPSFDEDLKNILIVKWLLSCVAAVMTPDDKQFFSKGVLVLQGAQNAGKTSWFKKLVGAEVSEYIKDGAHLDPSNKDSVFTAVSHWLVELGELDGTFRKADVAKLKAFITQSEDRLRRPYEARDSILPRRTIFFASVNDKSFLVDDTGNSRWWTIEVESINYNHTIDMQQVWAQIYESYFLNGAQHWLTQDEEMMLNTSNKEYEQIDPIEERILACFEFAVSYTQSGKREYKYTAVSEILATDILIKIGYERPDQRQRTKVGKILTAMGLKPKRSSKGSVYDMPKEVIHYAGGGAY